MTGWYSCIQFCPDAGRAERANIGVLLLCEEASFLETRMLHEMHRAADFFGLSRDSRAALYLAADAMADRLRIDKQDLLSQPALEHFIATRANSIILTPLRPMRVTDPSKDLDRLYRELVKWPPSGEKP